MHLSVLQGVTPLFGVIALGFVAGWLRALGEPDRAIDALNRYVLYFAFPLLMVDALADRHHALPGDAWFYLLPLALAPVALGLGRLGSRAVGVPAEAGPLSQGLLFGNTAYLGIPFAVAILGEPLAGAASIAAGVHLVIGLTLGPVALLRWGTHGDAPPPLADVARRLRRQPLLWAPLLGVSLRVLPAQAVHVALTPVAPVAASAGPVALFLLGLYLHTNRARVRQNPKPALALTIGKLAALPLVTAAAAALLEHRGLLAADARRVLVSMAAMPVGVTTFSLAREYRTGEQTLASGIVLTTALSLGTLPVVAALL